MDGKFFVCGGDMRFVKLTEELALRGCRVSAYGFDKTDLAEELMCASLKEGVAGADYIILPLPAAVGGFVNMPLSCKKLPLSELLSLCLPEQTIFAGMAGEELMSHNCCDYFRREELAIRNAVSTAEGAIQIAMEETPFTLWGSRCLVTGYGRIGRLLARDLAALGAKVTAEARKISDLAWIEAEGYTALPLRDMEHSLGSFDIIFNTVPHRIFNRPQLERLSKDTLIIDLASKPGGVDFTAASELGLHVIWALSLPGRVAPSSSGIIILDTIMNIIREWEVSP